MCLLSKESASNQLHLGLIAISLLSASVAAFAQWTDATVDTNAQYNQILFVNSLRGYIAASDDPSSTSTGRIFITTDGGNSWSGKDPPDSKGLLSLSAIGDSLVWATSSGTVWRSLDGGESWRADTLTNAQFELLTVQFVDTLHGWVTANYPTDGYVGYGAIFHSTNSGETWDQQYGDTVDYFSNLSRGFFADTLHGWVGDKYGLLQTTDGGSTWTTGGPSVINGPENIQTIFFVDKLHGWAAGVHGIAKTEDGGMTWQNIWYQFPGGAPTFNSVYFTDTANGWVCDNYGGIMHTTDGGNTWIVQRSDTSGYPALNSIFFLNKNDGWAAGNGIVLHTTNGGVSAVNEPLSHPKSFDLMQNYPNPFNPSTAISYQLSAVSDVTLKVYDILGRQVATLADRKESPGLHTVTWNASRLTSGVYFYRLALISSIGTFVKTKQMVLIK